MCGLHALFGFHVHRQDSFALGNDDAFISFRYARNLVEHGIPGFNPDDSPSVEGVSSPLHVARAAGVISLAGTGPVSAVMASFGACAMPAAILLVGGFWPGSRRGASAGSACRFWR